MQQALFEIDSKQASIDQAIAIEIGNNTRLNLDHANLLANHKAFVSLSPDSLESMQHSYDFIHSCTAKRVPIYGINTQFGDQVGILDEHLNNADALYFQSIHNRQMNLIRSHACGLGNPVPTEVVRLSMALRVHCLAQGYSGVSAEILHGILACLNADLIPIAYQYGSIGASGDLVPLATIAAGLIGENVEVTYKGCKMLAPQAFKQAGLVKLMPQIRDGLAMINGTSFMTAIASMALYRLNRLFAQMLCAVAMSLESMQVISSAYHPLVHQLKRHGGEMEVNDFFAKFWKGSQLLTDLDQLRNHTYSDSLSNIKNSRKSVQDYYSLRSIPQGFGPFRENLLRAIVWIENEMNSVNDNPIVDALNEQIHHGANFMGYYVTDSCDILKMNIAQASTWLHALLANLVHPRKNHNLPTNLVAEPDKYSGFRPMQLLAASLAVQNRKLAQSQQAFMLPTEGDNQDVNSLGTHAAFDFSEAVTNLERLTAILLLASTQALELRGIKNAGQKSQEIYHIVRQHSSSLIDRPMTEEINAITALLREGKISADILL